MISAAAAANDVVSDKSTVGRVKVVHIINGDLYAGAERVQDLLAKRLPEYGYDVSFVCLKEGAFQRLLEAGEGEVKTFAMRSRFDVARTPLRIAQQLRATGGQIIHTHSVRGALIGSFAAALTGLPMVHHVHSPTARDTTNGWTNRVNALVERVSLLRASALIPVSDSLARYLVTQGHSDSHISTVHNGVPYGEQRATGESGSALTLGMVALFRPRKGIEVLLNALASLREQGKPVRLHAVGTFEDPVYRRQVLSLSTRLGIADCVEWRGFRSDVLDELNRMDALVLPSLFGEGLPMVILEAMAVGLPVVASAVEGIPEAIREGHDGFLVPPGDPVALASALMRLADDPGKARSMGATGRRRQRELFSDEAMAAHVSRIYDRVLARGA